MLVISFSMVGCNDNLSEIDFEEKRINRIIQKNNEVLEQYTVNYLLSNKADSNLRVQLIDNDFKIESCILIKRKIDDNVFKINNSKEKSEKIAEVINVCKIFMKEKDILYSMEDLENEQNEIMLLEKIKVNINFAIQSAYIKSLLIIESYKAAKY